jgi:hypothetical protein
MRPFPDWFWVLVAVTAVCWVVILRWGQRRRASVKVDPVAVLRRLVRDYPDMLTGGGDMPSLDDWDDVRALEDAGFLEEAFFAGGGAITYRVTDAGGQFVRRSTATPNCRRDFFD